MEIERPINKLYPIERLNDYETLEYQQYEIESDNIVETISEDNVINSNGD